MNIRIANRNQSKLPIIGKLKIGIKKMSQGGKEYPASVDYFVPTGAFASYFTAQFGEKPNKIKIIFPSAESIVQKYELRDKQLYAESDGISLRFAKNKQWNEVTFKTNEDCFAEMDKLQKELNIKGVEWKKKLTMNFIIPELNGVFGIWQFETKAAQSMVDQIANMVDACEQMYGQINFIPFWLTVEMKDHRVFDENRKFPVVSISPMINPFQFQQIGSINEVLNVLKDGGSQNALARISEAALKDTIDNCATKVEISELSNKFLKEIELYKLQDYIKSKYANINTPNEKKD